MKRLPAYMRGAEVTDLTYDVAAAFFAIHGPITPQTIAEHLGVDEADVLTAYAELQQVGLME